MLKSIRVGVLDRHELVRYGLCIHLLEQPGFTVSGSYNCPANALSDARIKSLDILVIGHLVECTDCTKIIKVLSVEQPALKFLVLLEQPNLATAVMLLTSGAHGILCKSQPVTEYVDAIRSLVAGELYFCFRLVRDHRDRSAGFHSKLQIGTGPSWGTGSVLTTREREVLSLCASGLTVTQIAASSARSVKTISAQKQAAYRKLGLKNDLDFFKQWSF